MKILAHPDFRSSALVAGGYSILVVLCGFYFPWWILAPIAFAAGSWRASGAFAVMRIGLMSAAAWIGVAACQDIVSGGRLSYRIGAVMHMPASMAAYLAVGLIAFVMAGLAAQLGRSLKAAFQASKQED